MHGPRSGSGRPLALPPSRAGLSGVGCVAIDTDSANANALSGAPRFEPSSNGVPPRELVKALRHEYTGKVCEVMFDCFGDFEGFVLSDCHGSHTLKTRKRGIEEVVLRACKDRLLLTVSVEGHERRICGLAIRCG